MMYQTTIENEATKNKYRNVLFCLYTVATVAVYLLPYAKLMFPYIPVAILMLVSLPFLMMKKSSWGMYGVVLLFSTVLLFCIGFYALVDGINDAIRNLRLFLPILWGGYAITYCNKKQRIFLLLGFLAVTAVILISSMKALQEDPWIARILAQDQTTSSDEVNQYRLQNVGGYPFAYMVGVVTIGAAYLALNLRKFWKKLLAILAVIVCYYYIIQTMYTTLLLLTTVCIFVLLFCHMKSLLGKYFLFAAALLGVFLLPPLFSYLSGVFEGSLLSTKFEQMYLAMSGEGIESLGTRPRLVSEALQNWLKTPFFGGQYDTHAHSLLFEMLQTQGLFGLSVWIFLFVVTWRFMHKELKKAQADTTIFNVCMLYFTALSIFNDTRYTFEITIAIFFVIPVLASLMGTRRGAVTEKEKR